MNYVWLVKLILNSMEKNNLILRAGASLILTLLLSLSFAGCRDSQGDTLSPYGWRRVGEPFDSITAVMERRYLRYRDFDSIYADLDRLSEDAATDSLNHIKRARVLYWRGRLMMGQYKRDSAVMLFNEALELIDSTRYPYDIRRIRWNMEPEFGISDGKWYDKIIDDIEFYESVGDCMMAANRYKRLIATLVDIGYDRGETLKMFDKVDSLPKKAGLWPDYANMINRAYLVSEFDKDKAIAILDTLLADSIIRSNPAKITLLYRNLYFLTGDTINLRHGYDNIISNDSLNWRMKCYFESLLARNAVEKGDIAQARAYGDNAEHYIDRLNDLSLLIPAYIAQADVKTASKEYESANKWLYKLVNAIDSQKVNTAESKIIGMEMNKHISDIKQAADKASYRRSLILLSVIFVLIILVGIAGVIAYRKVQRHKLINMSEKLRVEQSERKILAMKLAMEEKDNMMTSIENEIDKLVEIGEMSQISTRKLKNAIKIHFAEEDERDNFIETFTKINPSFNERLRTRFPALSDTDLKLAAMISIGLENKQIARVLSIRPESVKQARWRLRSKFNLQSTDNLAEFLAGYRN